MARFACTNGLIANYQLSNIHAYSLDNQVCALQILSVGDDQEYYALCYYVIM